ncbi:MAG: hypothetical protein M0C28_44170 [Candidatus Moduliflexus flocculans]|nr:hypothetical protein [Candidatus Moduliflexus flocculans]
MTNQGDALENIYNLPGVPWCSFFTGAGNALHGSVLAQRLRASAQSRVREPAVRGGKIHLSLEHARPSRLDADYVHLPGEGTQIVQVNSNKEKQ